MSLEALTAPPPLPSPAPPGAAADQGHAIGNPVGRASTAGPLEFERNWEGSLGGARGGSREGSHPGPLEIGRSREGSLVGAVGCGGGRATVADDLITFTPGASNTRAAVTEQVTYPCAYDLILCMWPKAAKAQPAAVMHGQPMYAPLALPKGSMCWAPGSLALRPPARCRGLARQGRSRAVADGLAGVHPGRRVARPPGCA